MSQFKAMKFWIGNDDLGTGLREKIIKHLESLDYRADPSVKSNDGSIGTSGCGSITAVCGVENREYFNKNNRTEINIDWMRTPKKETIELNGKKYLKEDLTNEVGKQTMSALEEALKHLKPVN